MKSNTFFKLFIILMISLALRVWFLDKPEGLWNDEYVSWFIAQKLSFRDSVNAIFSNCHMPFYYLYIKCWLLFFPDTDMSLRLSSVFPSVLAIPAIYVCAREYFDKKIAKFTAFISAINSFLIYFAQEVRPYSLIFLFSTMVFYYFAKIINKNNKIDYILYFIFNALLAATHTLGIVFCIFNILFLFLYLSKENKNFDFKKFIKEKLIYFTPFFVVVLLLVPLMISIAFSGNLSQFWSNFSFSKLLFVFTDYLTPIQTNIINTPNNYFDFLFVEDKVNNSFLFFGIIPLILALFSIFYCLKENNKKLNFALYSALAFLVVILLLAIIGKMVLITKYTIEIYPIIIVILSCGLYKLLKNSNLKLIAIAYIILCLAYLIFAPNSAPKMERKEGNRAAVELIKYSPLKYGDVLLLTYYDKDKFLRYADLTKHYKVHSINKFNFNEIIFKDDNYHMVITNGKIIYKKEFQKEHNENIKKYMESLSAAQSKGERIGLLFLDNVSFIAPKDIIEISNNEKEYNKTSFIFLVFSMLKQNLMYSLKDDYILETITHSGDWSLYVYKKKN